MSRVVVGSIDFELEVVIEEETAEEAELDAAESELEEEGIEEEADAIGSGGVSK